MQMSPLTSCNALYMSQDLDQKLDHFSTVEIFVFRTHICDRHTMEQDTYVAVYKVCDFIFHVPLVILTVGY